MNESDWGEREALPDGKYLRYNAKTRRWYLYNKRGILVTSNRKKSVLESWREGE